MISDSITAVGHGVREMKYSVDKSYRGTSPVLVEREEWSDDWQQKQEHMVQMTMVEWWGSRMKNEVNGSRQRSFSVEWRSKKEFLLEVGVWSRGLGMGKDVKRSKLESM